MDRDDVDKRQRMKEELEGESGTGVINGVRVR